MLTYLVASNKGSMKNCSTRKFPAKDLKATKPSSAEVIITKKREEMERNLSRAR